MNSDKDAEGIPENPQERFDWILKRAMKLDAIRESNWIADEVDKLWNNPGEYEGGETYEVPEDVKEQDYVLFRLGVAFGTEYEYEFPREGGDE